MNEKLKFKRKLNHRSAYKSLNNLNINSTCEFLYPKPIFKINNIDSYSYMTSVIHLIYQISPLYKYYHNKVNSKNNKFSIHLHNTLVYYNNSKKSDISQDKRIIDITKLSSNLFNLNNKFIPDTPHDPVELLLLVIKNSACSDNFYIKNLKIKDECECSENNIFFVEKIQNIFNIPVKALLEIGNKNNGDIYSNKNKLINFYKRLISDNYLEKINCPLNGIDCNFNRVTRKIIIPNINYTIDSNISKESLINKNKSLTENIFFYYQYIHNYNDIVNKNINLLHLLLMIPLSFDISDLFDFEMNENNNNFYYLNALIFENKSNYFSCLIKLKNKWIYYIDNEEKIFTHYYQFIKYALKNNLFPYILMYSLKNVGDYSNDVIAKSQYDEIIKYVTVVDEFKQKNINEKFQLFNITKSEDDLTLQQSSTECEEKKLSISQNYNINNCNNSNTPIHITKNLEIPSTNNLVKKNSCTNIKNSKISDLLNNNTNFLSEKDRSIDGIKKVSQFKLSPLSSGNINFNINDIKITNNNKSLNLMNLNENNVINSAKEYPLHLTEEKIKPFLITNNLNNNRKINNNCKNHNKMTKQMTDINLVNSITPPEMWICDNCNKVNKANDYKCRSCKIINKKQQELINIFNSLSIGNIDNAKNILTTNSNNINVNNNFISRTIRSKSGRIFANHYLDNPNTVNNSRVKCACYTEMKDKVIKNCVCILCGRDIRSSTNAIIYPIKTDNNIMNKTTNVFYGKKVGINRFYNNNKLIKTKSTEKIKIKHKLKNKADLYKELIKEYQRKIKNENFVSSQINK